MNLHLHKFDLKVHYYNIAYISLCSAVIILAKCYNLKAALGFIVAIFGNDRGRSNKLEFEQILKKTNLSFSQTNKIYHMKIYTFLSSDPFEMHKI